MTLQHALLVLLCRTFKSHGAWVQTTPHGSRSTNMSLQDSHALGQCLAASLHDIPKALQAFESKRMEQTSREAKPFATSGGFTVPCSNFLCIAMSDIGMTNLPELTWASISVRLMQPQGQVGLMYDHKIVVSILMIPSKHVQHLKSQGRSLVQVGHLIDGRICSTWHPNRVLPGPQTSSLRKCIPF